MDFTADVRLLIKSNPSDVVIPGGQTVQALAGVASEQPDLGGSSIVIGRTRTLTFATADVPTLEEGQTLTWNARTWLVIQLALFARGAGTRAYLGAA